MLARELENCARRLAPKTFVRSIGLLGALEVDGVDPATWNVLAAELAKAKISLHVEGRRSMAIFAPPLCITEAELVDGVRRFGDAAVTAFGGVK